jgi:integrase/recombinase XerD
MFLCQDPKHQGERLGCKGLYKMVKKVAITRKGLDPLYGKDLMGIKSDKVYRRYTQGALKQSAAKAYLQAIGEDED